MSVEEIVYNNLYKQLGEMLDSMTLEQFKQDSYVEITAFRNASIASMEEYAKQESVAFAEWKEGYTKLRGKYFHRKGGMMLGHFASNFNEDDGLNLEQLYELYQQSKIKP